jgi:rhodanese-related sulfurtransferase
VPRKNKLRIKLSESPIFAYIPEENLLNIAQNAQAESVPARTIIFRKGDPGDKFYIINSGRVRLFRKVNEGVEIDLEELGPGHGFGEVALLAGKPRSEYAEAIEETSLTVFPKNQFDRILSNHPHILLALAKQLSSWLLRGYSKLERKAERELRVSNYSWFDFLIIFGLSLLLGVIFNLSNPNGIKVIPRFWSNEAVTVVTGSQAMAKHIEGKALFVDARPRNLYEKRHIKGAISLPLSLFDIMYGMHISEVDKEKEIIIYGRTISRLYDEQVARKLIVWGHRNTKILSGGLSEWEKDGYPVQP